MIKYQAIIFDFDGVLFDSEKIHLNTYNQIFKVFGFTVPEEEYFQHYVGLSDNEMFDLILKNKNIVSDPEQIKMLNKNKIAAYKEFISHCKSLDGVRGVKVFIETHAKTLNNFAICSNASRDEIEATLIKLENGTLKGYFKDIISIDDISMGKPSPEGYLLAANRLNVSPKHCIAIEDTPVGVSAAKAAGMTVIGITTTHEKSMLKDADFIAYDYNEIDSWIKVQYHNKHI